MSYSSRNLIEKIWDRHVVSQQPDAPAVLYIDLHLVHEVTSPQAFQGLRERGLKVRRPDRTNATIDHSIPTCWGDSPLSYADELSIRQIHQLEENCSQFKVPLHGLGSERRGIVHIIGPELALTQPGMTIVCGDSHTATHGAFGALAFGIGTSEVEQVLASQSILQQKPKTCLVTIEGELGKGVSAKDVILALIGQIGVNGGTGYVLEYGGSTVRALDMEGRMTLCNMTIEAGARAGLVAPDETTFSYLKNREFAPQGSHWEQAVKDWRTLYSDEGSTYDKTIHLDASGLEPQVTYGTNPSMVIPITGKVPEKANPAALKYMGLKAGQKIQGQKIDVVFLGSCTNGRISDLRQAAALLKGRKIAAGVRMLAVPGSEKVKKQAEQEGLDQIFREAGAEWRQAGCSMCIAMNGDQLTPGQAAVSTSNRNFEGRQGKGSRTFLASPLTAAAAALAGCISDPRDWMKQENPA